VASVRKRSRSQIIAVRVARAAPWLLTFSSMPALTLIATASGVLVGLIAASGIHAPPLARPGYPIDPTHRPRLAEPLTRPKPLPILAGPPQPGWRDPAASLDELEAGFRWTLQAGLRDAAHCPSTTIDFHQGCVDAVASAFPPPDES